MILLIDNYDSFSYNLYQCMGEINPDIRVIRNDELTVQEVAALKPDKIVISPGPGYPSGAGICLQAIKELGPKIPILGVCLGHQAICQAFGATIAHAKRLVHGKQSQIVLCNSSLLFKGMPSAIKAARYHSLAAVSASMPPCLRVTATTIDNEIMAVEHATYPIYGVQFHPESILTPEGKAILKNFLLA